MASYPGDIVSGALAFWGLRAYTAAIAAAATQKLIQVTRSSDSATADVLVAINGGLGVTANASAGSNGVDVVTWSAGAAFIFVSKMYDQSGNANDVTQSTNAQQPVLLQNIFGPTNNLAGMRAQGNSFDAFTATLSSLAQPATMMAFANNPSFTAGNDLFNGTTLNNPFFYFFAANTLRMFTQGGNFTATAADGSPHSIIGVVNSSSSSITVDGTTTNGSVGTDTLDHGIGMFGGASSLMRAAEFGVWGSAFNSTQISNMASNQHAYWIGANAACPSRALLGVGCFIGWRATLPLAAVWRVGKALGDNPVLTRRRLIGKMG